MHHLDSPLLRRIEEHWQCDFGQVRLHWNGLPRQLGAAAFAYGDDICLDPGLTPDHPSFPKLLRHELAHVAQQRKATRSARGALIILDDPLLEHEADGAVGSLLSPAPMAPVIQCSILRYQVKASIREMIDRLVQQMTPGELGGATTLGTYVDAVLDFIRAHDYILSGEKHDFSKLNAKKTSQLPQYAQTGGRVYAHHFDRGDWAWLRRTVTHFAKLHRFGNSEYDGLTTRLVPEYPQNHQWVGWESADCVYSAIQIVMGLRFVGYGKEVEAIELEIALALTKELGMPRSTVQDESMVWLLEQRLGWPRMPAKTIGELFASTANQANSVFVISACQNVDTDFWHTVIGVRKAKKLQIIDRQYERKFHQEGTLPGDPNREATAWLTDPNSPLIVQLKQKLRVDELRKTHAKHLEL
jgi:hypothetical protein